MRQHLGQDNRIGTSQEGSDVIAAFVVLFGVAFAACAGIIWVTGWSASSLSVLLPAIGIGVAAGFAFSWRTYKRRLHDAAELRRARERDREQEVRQAISQMAGAPGNTRGSGE